MATDICTRVGERIKTLRKQRGWSQQILADHAQLSKVHIIAVEKGRAELGVRTLERIANALEVPAPDLLR